MKKWAVGVELAYAHNGYDGDKLNSNAFALAPYARYSFYETRLYVCSWIWDLDSLLIKRNMQSL